MKTASSFIILFAFFYHGLVAQNNNFSLSVQLSSPPGDLGNSNQFFTSAPTTKTVEEAMSYALLVEYKVGSIQLRLRGGIEKLETLYEQNQMNSDGITESITILSNGISQDRIFIAPGITWNMVEKDRFSFAAGFELPFRRFFDYKNNNKFSATTMNVAQQRLTFQGSEETKITVPLGFSAGLGAILQFNYRLFGGVIIGAEAAPTLTYVKHNVKNGRIERYNNGNLTSTDAYNGSYKKTFFQENRFSINLGYQF